MEKQKQKLRPIMIVGTASDVGKSIITAGLCRIFKLDGYQPAPFKAQNMSLNSYATPEGLEIGRAQAVQAEAAGIPCHTDMNPVLLKPTTDKSSQVVVNGKPAGNQSAYDYFQGNNRQKLFEVACEAYDRLSGRYHPVVLEGAGSISELNLKKRDISNMRMAMHAGAATYLVGDIDRGGIFASLYGTIKLLTPEERASIKGIIINKFRGDSRLFDDGRKMIEELCGLPVVGVIPWFSDIFIEEEDSVSLEKKVQKAVEGKANIAVIRLKRMSNFTDFDRLEKDPRVNLYYTNQPEEIKKADIIILPGSKNTTEDLADIRNNGAEEAVKLAFRNGKTVIGICGGYQMMGKLIEDPEGLESTVESISGMGILPVKTILQPVKTTRQCSFTFTGSPEPCKGYEIHMGHTTAPEGAQPVARFQDGHTDGFFLHKKCWGTYLHGILDNNSVINELLKEHTTTPEEATDYHEYKEAQYNRLASLLRSHLDMEKIYRELIGYEV